MAHYKDKTIESNYLDIVFRTILLATVIFPVIVLISRAIFRRNIEFKILDISPKINKGDDAPPINKGDDVPPINKGDVISPINKGDDIPPLLEVDNDNKVTIDKPFSIKLFHSSSTGHHGWKVLEIPSFIEPPRQYFIHEEYIPGTCGNGNDYVFIFKAKRAGRGKIVMEQPCSFDSSRTEKAIFTITAE